MAPATPRGPLAPPAPRPQAPAPPPEPRGDARPPPPGTPPQKEGLNLDDVNRLFELVGFPRRDLAKLETAIDNSHRFVWVRSTKQSRIQKLGQCVAIARWGPGREGRARGAVRRQGGCVGGGYPARPAGDLGEGGARGPGPGAPPP